MTDQTKTINDPQIMALQSTAIPHLNEGQSQICGISGNQFAQYDSRNPNLSIQPQSYETSFITVEYTRTIKDHWIEMPTLYRNSVIYVTAIIFGIAAGIIALGLSAALERLLQ